MITCSKKFKHFTLLELIISMAIFVVLISVILNLHNSVDRATSQSKANIAMFENARIALELMTRDIQTIYYENGAIPFWHWKPADPYNPPSGWGTNRNEFLAFTSATSIPPNLEVDTDFNSSLCEIKYQKYYADSHDSDSDGWLMRSATGDIDEQGVTNIKWNYHSNFNVGYTTQIDTDPESLTYGELISAYTVDSSSSEEYRKLIPHVVDLTFTCYDKNDNEIAADTTSTTASDSGQTTKFPFYIKIDLTLLDKNSWEKWIKLGGNVNPNNDSGSAETFRESHERTFSKIIYIGNRGQYD